MGFNWHTFLQTLLVGLQSGNALTGILPPKWQGLVTILLSATQAGLALVATNNAPPLPPAHIIGGKQ
jgi:hypothetical protein